MAHSQSSPECYLYLHGFASSPNSAKARELGDRFQDLGIALEIPDLNQDDFSHLSLSRQLAQVEALLPDRPVTVIGSSFGGLTAAWLAERNPQIQRLVLLAPAFQFLAHWLPRLGSEQLLRWQQEQYMAVYHYAAQTELPLQYGFVTDLAEYHDGDLGRSLPTLILHGVHDDVIPVQASRDYAEQRPWVKLIELESDHSLANVSDRIWQEIQAFCELPLL